MKIGIILIKIAEGILLMPFVEVDEFPVGMRMFQIRMGKIRRAFVSKKLNLCKNKKYFFRYF